MATLGKNTPQTEELTAFIERVEKLNGEIADLQEDRKTVFQEAKSKGFSTRQMRRLVKVRKMKPHDHQEDEAEFAVYEHAMGMATEPPLLRFMAKAATDVAVRDQVIEAMKSFVPPHGKGDITVTMEGKPVRLARTKDGTVELFDVEKPLPFQPSRKPAARPSRPPPPDVDAAGAEALGRQYAKDNRPIIDNPFPFGDTRRPRFDKGWRDETGNDGMGPQDDDE
jgi:uncharacterized protein (UPF0335 family)